MIVSQDDENSSDLPMKLDSVHLKPSAPEDVMENL